MVKTEFPKKGSGMSRRVMELANKGIPVCPQCERKTIYFRKDGSVRCRACGYDGEFEATK
jgi:uncharacterized Zn finger protein (UPF0148 family)